MLNPEVYPMSKKLRGHCIIINYEETEDSKMDAQNLVVLFVKLGFKVN